MAAIIATSANRDSTVGPEPPLPLQIVAYAALGAAAGLLMGAARWAVLRRVADPGRWVA